MVRSGSGISGLDVDLPPLAAGRLFSASRPVAGIEGSNSGRAVLRPLPFASGMPVREWIFISAAVAVEAKNYI